MPSGGVCVQIDIILVDGALFPVPRAGVVKIKPYASSKQSHHGLGGSRSSCGRLNRTSCLRLDTFYFKTPMGFILQVTTINSRCIEDPTNKAVPLLRIVVLVVLVTDAERSDLYLNCVFVHRYRHLHISSPHTPRVVFLHQKTTTSSTPRI